MRRQHLLSSTFLLILLPSTALGSGPVIEASTEDQEVFDLRHPFKLTLDLDYYRPPPADPLAAITMRSLPPGSLIVRYDGLHSFAIKHVRSQFRRFVRRAVRRGWYVVPYETERHDLFERVDHGLAGLQTNGVWWQRAWYHSLPPEAGGAPKVPYVHTHGCRTAWKFGPFTLTNTFKLKFDYVAFFELNPDPVSPDHPDRLPPLSLDVRPIRNASFGTHFRFKLKPHIRVGLPRDGDWTSVLRSLSLQGSFEIYHRGRPLIEGDVEVRWSSRDGAVLSFELALASW